ncbi:Mitochondrial import receptor subunit tom70 AltName: Full=72 kDa mitochondrial outer membrane protein; AltName: Full=Mitochondrial import receptor for the ADP/ATP carrier; AltName: Full=Mitochondrial precursor proteins import receptor; AltName: Full=Translocase of outer membrane tom70 [Serendipita indica DSM 11827]|nr:Mitochondrial import receptor subunit tom70 AltName: Full=72 kDa mitochondrial outer membrane protein; AltName: Full=Mitochondrial import receptor for the ADP/ATP carrier; AltName: Full=Mitochondrial precursor proteins import receptor; AltName: Full=Translocase of outer membrane tom70 [Serendipita indica DSM 11827]
MSGPSSSPPQHDGIVSSVQNFVSEHKKLVIGVAAAAVATAVAVVLYTNSASLSADDLERGDEKRHAKKKKSKTAKGKKSSPTKTTFDPNGPILEEVPKEDVPTSPPNGVDPEISGLSAEARERTKRATALKTKGNTAYQQRQFAKAAQLYTQAIEMAVVPEAVFYSNRAACYVNYSPPQHERVVADCDEALKLDPTYIKALNRRATALEALGRLEEAVRDFVASSFLDGMSNSNTAEAVDRTLRRLSDEKAVQTLASREPRLPADSLIAAYFSSYRPRPLPILPDEPTIADKQLLLASEALLAKDYKHAMVLVNESLVPLEPGQGLSTPVLEAEALTLSGSFRYLMQDPVGAKEQFTKALELNPKSIHTWLKMANIHLDQNNLEESMLCFEKALEHNSKDPDIYYHRGQIYFVMNEFVKAAEDYATSTELDKTFVFSHIQLAVAHYKSGSIQKSMAEFRRIMKEFPKHSEPPNYYGEVLLDQERYSDAIEKFEKAIELEKSKGPPMNVLPLVNKSLALFQWKKDGATAEKFCLEALEIDPLCEAAFATLGQIYLAQQQFDKALTKFRELTQISSNAPQLSLTFYHIYSTEAQVQFIKNYPNMASRFT